MSGSVFDSTVDLYTHIQGEMVRTLASYVFTEVRARSQPYRKDKWFYTTNPKALLDSNKITDPSPSICPLLEVLARHLHALRDVLATPLFTQLWKIVADTLNKVGFCVMLFMPFAFHLLMDFPSNKCIILKNYSFQSCN